MSITEAVQRFERARAEVKAQLPAIFMLAGLDALAVIKLRVQNTGINEDNQPYSDYSDNPLPAFFHYGRGYGSGVEEKVKKKNKENDYKGVSYRDVREFAGKPTSFKNFSMTQAMWNDIGVRLERQGDGTAVVVGPKTESERKKLAYVGEQEGRPILRLADQEMNDILQDTGTRVIRIINQAIS